MAGTTRNAIRGALKLVDEALGDKTIPQSMRDALSHLRASMQKTWNDMTASDKDETKTDESLRDAESSARLQEQASIAQNLEARIDDAITDMCNNMYAWGTINRAEWVALDDDAEDALDGLMEMLLEDAPSLFERGPGDECPDEPEDDEGAEDVPTGSDVSMSASEADMTTAGVDERGWPKGKPHPRAKKGAAKRARTGRKHAGGRHRAMAASTDDYTPQMTEKDNDPNVGGGVDRDKIPAEDFAGKNRSYPIVKPGDVSDAASSIGRAGADNYSSDTLKANIIRIATRKGASFVAELPKAWSDTKESADIDLTSDVIMLTEAGSGSTIPIKIIQPGWGSSGYYSKEVLQRDGPKVFPAGTHMYMDHPTAQEEAARPERSVKDLAAVTMSDAHWMDEGKDGPGLYAEAKPFSDSAQRIKEMAHHIGVSIRASGQAENGEVEGRKGPVIKSITQGKSIDFVTQAGAGGKVLAESARNQSAAANLSADDPGGQTVEGKELLERLQKLENDLTSTKAENARLREVNVLREAKEFVSLTLPGTLPALTRTRLIESLSLNPVMKDGAIDKEAYAAAVAESVKNEMAYLASITGSGQIRGMGGSAQAGSPDAASADAALVESFKGLGYSDAMAKLMAQGRN